jgi:phosphoglycolate phosphatase
MTGFRNIIFDWSGTLNDEIRTSYAANMILMRRFGGIEMPFEQYKEEFELPYMNWYRKYFPGIENEKVHQAYVEALEQVPKPKCFPWAEGLLRELKADGRDLVIFSALHLATLRLLIQEHGMEAYFRIVRGGILDKRLAIKGLLQECRFKESETAFIGDMVHDIDAGKVAGITTIAVTWGYDSRKKLEKAAPDHITESIGELRDILFTRI